MGNVKRIILALAVTTIVVGGLVGCGSNSSKKSGSTVTNDSSIAAIKKRGTIKIGVFSDKAPFGYVDSNGKNQGFDVVIAKRFAKDLLGDETKVQFVLVDAASRVAYLESKKVDIIMANFTVTDERKQKVDFANPYMKVSLGIVAPNSAKITSIDQLKGKKVIIAKGTTAETYLTKTYPDIQLLKFEQYSEIFQALKDKRGDAIVSDNTEVIAWAKDNPTFNVGVPSLGAEDTIAPAVAKGNNELKDWINTELVTLGKEKFVHKAYESTLTPVYGANYEENIVIEGGKLK
ncbi:cysteine ABC transporter substrate-binding protein [Clostridium estertheticum]|uniref:Cysteine ABC transporter substrate-binding protein n=1 Tax=Clostridium estertheticum TaxID=238834 RepID=A0A7Y3SXX0_9CLOT|nr:cysteine ABC transporter substrate-binding protein [Clostridium estertheticum]MBU3154516.1 cysteine ABC transporter substrate-binding protein [Clostridium estertheticum]MBU3185866.1 cysteine ABC transporter substrate-binding protein [Clostridium estertheticum]MBU3201269.1 cysteine ABC transporter substrate-binding protein [Clostridium estertheticum]MBW9152636.1 cysteine ABC transporter substrate-binding protein [Clostridium estertheticum]MBW9171983.1 cysteine ABC transporter substrate-bindi